MPQSRPQAETQKRDRREVRVTVAALFLGCAMAAGLLPASQAIAQEQTREQRACLSSMGAFVNRIDTTQASESQNCVKAFQKDKASEPTVAACQVADGKGRMLKLEAKITEKQTDPSKGKCIGAAEPDFAFVDPADMVTDASGAQADFLFEVLGSDPNAVVVDATDRANRDLAGCQNIIVRMANKIVASEVKAFKMCMNSGLRSRTLPITSAAELEGCFTGDPKLTEKADRAELKLNEQIVKKCDEKSVDFQTVVAGECADTTATAATYAECIREKADCAACQVVNGGYGLTIDCDVADNGVEDSSCGGGPSPRGAFVDGPIIF